MVGDIRKVIKIGFVLLLLAAIIIGGCSSGSTQEGGAGDKADENKKVEIRFIMALDPIRYEGYKKLIDKWNSDHPNIQVKLENLPGTEYQKKLQVMTASNSMPDLFWWQPSWGADWLQNGQLYPIDEFVKNEPDIKMDDFLKVMIHYLTYDGKLYGLPYDIGADVLFYNKDLFDKAGIAYPTDNWTFDDVRQAAKKITETVKSDKGKVYGLVSTLMGAWRAESTYLSYGTSLITKDGKIGINNSAGIQALKYFKENIDMGITPKPESGTTFSSIWMNGMGAMMTEGGWNIPTYEKAAFKWDMVKLPKGPSGQYASGLGGAYAISKQSKYPKQTFQFLKFLTSTEGLNEVVTKVNGGVPARVSAQEGLTPVQKKYADLIKDASYFNAVSGALDVFDLHQKETEQLWYGQKSAEDVAKTIQEQGDKILEQKRKK